MKGGLNKYFAGKTKSSTNKGDKKEAKLKSPIKPSTPKKKKKVEEKKESGSTPRSKAGDKKSSRASNKSQDGKKSQKSTPRKTKVEFTPKSPASNKEDSSSRPRTRKRLKRNTQDEDIDLVNVKASNKGETSADYFDKFAHKEGKLKKKTTPKKATPKKSTPKKATPKKSGLDKKPTPQRRSRRNKRVDSDEDYREDPEEAKELEDCISDSLDLEDVISGSDQTEKVEEPVSRKRKPAAVEEEKKRGKRLKFDEKKVSTKRIETKSPSKEASSRPTPSDPTPLEGVTFVFTGLFENISRERLEKFVIDLGGRVTSGVSGKTTYLITGYKLEDGREVNTSSKFRKAKEKGISTMTESELEDHLKRVLGNKHFTFEYYEDWTDPEFCKKRAEGTLDDKATVNPDSSAAAMTKNILLTEKYKPVTTKDLVGNKSEVKSLSEWLKEWDDVHVRGNKKKVPMSRGNYWANAPRLNARAALISGPPGVGKTSTARIISKELGFQVLEMNASDTRNKKAIESLVGELSSNKSMDYFIQGRDNSKRLTANLSKKSVIIMDEVDGCGGGDRGGIAALIKVIKVTRTPIICICNDRENRKLATLINHCFEAKFTRPRESQIIGRIRQIASAEGLKIDDKVIGLLINQSGSDIRQVITQLQIMLTTTKSLSFKDIKERISRTSKDKILMINNFQAANKLLNKNEFDDMSFKERMDMFFIDYDFVPLLVHENYLGAIDNGFQGGLNDLKRMANAASYISLGDTVNRRVRGNMEWTLLQDLGFTSSIAPCHYSEGQCHYPRFPQWLGKNSSTIKSRRLINELKKSMGHRAQ